MTLLKGRIGSSLRRSSVFALGWVLSACTTLGPNYQEPEVQWLAQWQPDLYGQLSSENSQEAIDLAFWWQLFDDPVLNQLIHISKQENIDLRLAGLRILESRAQLGIVGSTLYPQLQQLSGSVIAAESRRRGGLLPDKDQGLINYQAGFGLGWELDFWGKYQRSIEAADAAFFSSVANQQNMQVLLSAQVTDLYFVYRTIEHRIAIAKSNADIQQRSFEITEKIYQEGQESELDLQQAKAQYLATLSTIPKLEMSLTTTRNALALILARPPGEIAELTVSSVKSLPKVDMVNLQHIPAHLLIRRPDIRSSAWQVAIQSAQIGIAESDYYPSISLSGTISWSGSTADAASDNGLIGVGPGFTWNIFDHGRIENNIRVQDARFQQTLERYQQTVLSAAREIDDAAIAIVKTSEQFVILEQAVQASERALSLANTRYREGYSSFQRVLDAQRAVFSRTEQLVLNRGEHVRSVVSLYKALGGGWTEHSIDELMPPPLKEIMEKRTDWGELLTTPNIESTENTAAELEPEYGASQYDQ
ncbi:efflux transporter outer membrane subunit [Thalassotalea atypica]|uniref:efflux transporter outer membrane subunit n=1 Tax=Thalassotalea atypica TaxID=2054316 RepID=UPI00257241C7|nr:efflux transporter outer membrane subunit [Thalassotalea atypica]